MTEPIASTTDRSDNTTSHQPTRPLVMHARVVTSTGGGPDKTILNSPRFLDQLGYQSDCMFFRPPNDDGFDVLRRRANDWAAPLIEIDDRGKIDFRAIRQAINVCRERKVHIWHAHDYKTNLIGLIVRWFHPMKLVTTAHGWVNFSGQTPLYYRLDKKWWLPKYDRVICVSSTVLEQCLQANVPRSKCVLIENAIDHDQFHRQRPIDIAKRERFGVQKGQLLVGSIGRIASEKGYDLLITAFKRVIDQGVDAKLVIGGEGPDEEHLLSLADSYGLGDRFQLVGFCADTREFLESLDLFVLSSLREGLPNTVLEAMSVGVAVIGTDVGGVGRVIEDNVNGLLIDAGSSDAIAEAILKLAEDVDTRIEYGRKARETITLDWSFEARMSKVTQIYTDLLSTP